MAEFKLDRIRFRWKSTWVISTEYIKDDIVLYQGKAYVCLITHSSDPSLFYNDLEDTAPKWELMLDGYVWREDWAPSTYYTEGEIVKFKGYVYQCIASHTSTIVVSLGLPANANDWKIIATTYNWTSEWVPLAYYDLGDVVTYNGITYICNTKHRANSSTTFGLEADQIKWTIVTRSDYWRQDWTVSTRYKLDDVVKYGAIVYRCIDDHTSSATAALGLEADQTKWQIVSSGIEYKSDWTASTRYKLNDIVKWNHSLWICTTYHTSVITNLREDESNWTVWVPGTGFENVWISSVEYKKGDIVLHGGYAYTALANNISSVPSVNGLDQDTGNWELLKQGYRHRGEWDVTTTYKTGDVVRNKGYLYIAFADNASIQPDTGTHWTVLVTGSYWNAEWAEDVIYSLGDIVTFASTSHYCVQRHNSLTSNSRPDADVTNTYWIVLVQGTATNVLTTRGDIRTHDGLTTVRKEIGTTGNLLKVADNALAWANFEQINKVYYVATTGQDSTDNGKTLASPFRTIKYAMNYILNDQATRAPATVFVKTGVYEELLPITIPATVALVGDELRSTIIQPAAGFEISNMFYVRNGSGIRNCTLQGLSGTLGAPGPNGTSRPSAGAFVSLDPGSGPADNSTWITTKSPYVQNVTTFGTGCIGMKIDGSLHNGGNRSIVANDFTQIISDGIGYWASDLGRSELVSVFTYYCYIGYLSTGGGILRATNGNNSYGTYGSRAEGFDAAEEPINAEIDNKTFEAQVEVVHTNGSKVLAIGYSNAGAEYTTATATIVGSGAAFNAVYEEFRNDAIGEIRIISETDTILPGGLNYQNILNSAQSGDTVSITLAAADDTGTSEMYEGMRIFLESGNGVGQYGQITDYDAVSKIALIGRESDGEPGWDHVYPGYPIESVLDSTTRYRIEPRVVISEPSVTIADIASPSSNGWTFIAAGNNKFVASTIGGPGTSYASYSANGTTWSTPVSIGTDYAYSGLVYTGSKFLLARRTENGLPASGISQSADGETWSSVALPGTARNWTSIAASDDTVVLIGGDSQSVLYSVDHGDNWSTATIPGTTEAWGPAAYGNGKFVTIDTVSGAVATSTNGGVTWTVTSSALDIQTWNSITYGNGRFVVISSAGNFVSYSFDGINWFSSLIATGTYTFVSYGAGVFIASGTGNTIARSADGKVWRTTSDTNEIFELSGTGNWKYSAYNNGKWVLTQAASSSWNTITTGARAMARVLVSSSRLSKFIIYDPGSNYAVFPVITVVDPENTADATISPRMFDGVIPQPVFRNPGTGYVTATITISGDGYADKFQTGNSIRLKNLERIPGPGDNLIITGITSTVYRVVAVDSTSGSEPALNAVVRVSPTIDNYESPGHETSVIIRQLYSQVRLTGHDFLDIGAGNFENSNYPTRYVEGYVSENEPLQENEVTEIAGGRCFYTSTDQDGNFRVGELFRVEQATGIVSINADFFQLEGLTELSLGGIQVGGSAVVIREFSKESGFVANSNNIVPTQRAIKTYLESRITSGGSDAVTNTLIAGRVRVSGTTISTTSDEAIEIDVPVNHRGGISGDYLAMQYFAAGQKVG